MAVQVEMERDHQGRIGSKRPTHPWISRVLYSRIYAVCDSDSAEESGICRGGGVDAGAGNRSEYCDLQRSGCCTAAAAAAYACQTPGADLGDAPDVSPSGGGVSRLRRLAGASDILRTTGGLGLSKFSDHGRWRAGESGWEHRLGRFSFYDRVEAGAGARIR